MTHLVNDAADFADEALDGLVAAHGRYVRKVHGGAVRAMQTSTSCSKRPSIWSRRALRPRKPSTSSYARHSGTDWRSSADSPSPTWPAWMSTAPALALWSRYGERLKASEMLNELVEAGKYGVKQGGGFVTEAGDQTALIAYRNTAYARLGQLLRELGPAPN
jgi:hypothetical protein